MCMYIHNRTHTYTHVYISSQTHRGDRKIDTETPGHRDTETQRDGDTETCGGFADTV